MMPGLSVSPYPLPGNMAWPVGQFQAALPKESILSPGLQFFISRDDGSLVPLVPIDELPDDVRLIGVPSKLNPSQAKEMTFVGYLPSVGRRFSNDKFLNVRESNDASSANPKYTPQAEIPSRSTFVPQAVELDPHARHQPATPPVPSSRPVTTPAPVFKDPKSSKPKALYNERPLPPSGVEPDPKKKVYCTYWIQHASCNFAQQGCLYKHEMPDIQTLRSIGIHKYPVWWQKKQARKRSGSHTGHDGTSSEWEEVERQQLESSALHKDDPVRIRVPSSRPTSCKPAKQTVLTPRAKTVMDKASAAAAAVATSDSPSPSSSQGGVQLGAAKSPVCGPPLAFNKTALESPIEENLIDFEVLVPSSASDISSSSQSSPEQATARAPANNTVRGNNKTAHSGGVVVSSAPSADRRSNNPSRDRRTFANRKTDMGSPSLRFSNKDKSKHQDQYVGSDAGKGKGKVDQSTDLSRKGKVKTAPADGKQSKSATEVDE